MPPALTHDECRSYMCAACGGKAGDRKVTADLGENIRMWAQPNGALMLSAFLLGSVRLAGGS